MQLPHTTLGMEIRVRCFKNLISGRGMGALVSALLAIITSSGAFAQGPEPPPPPSPRGGMIDRLDPSLDKLISPSARVALVYSEPGSAYEGPTWVPGKPGH